MPPERVIYLSPTAGTWAMVGLFVLAFVIVVILIVVLRILRSLTLELDYLAYIKSVVQTIRKEIEQTQKPEEKGGTSFGEVFPPRSPDAGRREPPQ